MSLALHPFVYWAQQQSQITLKVDVFKAEEPNIILEDRLIKFTCTGVRDNGSTLYSFKINFYEDINIKESSYKVYDSKIELQIYKLSNFWWPRLTAQPQKQHWLKIDFDRWRSEEDDIELSNNIGKSDRNFMNETRNIMEDYPGVHEKLQKQEYGYIKENGKNVYLIFYNLFQFIGFLFILIVIGVCYYRDGAASLPETYMRVGKAFKFWQLLQYMEAMHPLFGYTKGSPLLPFAQITGRIFILFVMIDSEERMQTKPVVFYLFIIWALIEVVRYPYYITTILNKQIAVLTWLRYTIWIPLYPLGILCESIIILRNIPYFEETNRFSITMPNSYNFTFNLPIFMKMYLIFLIVPGIYFLMNHMAQARIKKLGGNKKKLKKVN